MRPLPARIESSGLPNRGIALIHRDESLYPAMVLRLEGRGKASPSGAGARLTMELLAAGFGGGKTQPLIAATFLAGRCDPRDAGDGVELDAALRAVVDGLDVARLAARAPAFVEASMSIGLRGDGETAMNHLRDVAADGGVGSTHDVLAAYYLAQFGDASGWRAMTHALTSADEHTRHEALRHLIAFVAFDGTEVDGDIIDVRAALLEHVDDVATIATEIPSLLAETGFDEIDAALAEIEATADRDDVRAAAARVRSSLATG